MSVDASRMMQHRELADLAWDAVIAAAEGETGDAERFMNAFERRLAEAMGLEISPDGLTLSETAPSPWVSRRPSAS